MSRAGALAVTRFGLGARPGEIDAASADPAGWLRTQLDPARADPAIPAHRGDGAATALIRAHRQGPEALEALTRGEMRAQYLRDCATYLRGMTETRLPFRERLVQFWANHFTVSGQRPVIHALLVPYVAEAIRPHVLGHFADMLRAVVRHTAMMVYLDNARSIGPNSPLGQRRGKGLNENLAREVLELHTLGVKGGYDQADVGALARILTGWSLAGPEDAQSGRYMFRPMAHEPGPKTLLGRRYAEDGEGEGIAALNDLAAHPATARHIAEKFARHFLADDPPATAIDTLAARFRASHGDLAALARAVIDLPAAWAEPQAKFKTPLELMVSLLRLLSVGGDDFDKPVKAVAALGQRMFAAPSPAGWSDRAADWTGAEAVMRRLELTTRIARTAARHHDPRALADTALGALQSERLRGAIARAPSPQSGLALLFAAPEFQRR